MRDGSKKDLFITGSVFTALGKIATAVAPIFGTKLFSDDLKKEGQLVQAGGSALDILGGLFMWLANTVGGFDKTSG